MKTFIKCTMALCIVLCCNVVQGQKSQLSDGFVLIAPLGHDSAYLVNADKEIVHTWNYGSSPANATYLLPDGGLMCTSKVENRRFQARGGAGGKVYRVDRGGNVVWEYQVSDDNVHSHHDIEPLPNGNVLVIAWEHRSREQAIEAGRDPQTIREGALWPETILEIKPVGRNGGEVVWKWSLWDHLIQSFDKSKANYGDVSDHPELVDINFGIRRGGADWIHMNSVHYNAEKNLIAMSARWFDEVWIIDHSTTTEEAASHSGGKHGKGGDLLYRWGNPQAYLGGWPSDRKFFAQHDVRWIEKDRPGGGEMLVFNNGDRNAENHYYSSVDQFKLPMNADGTFKFSTTEPVAPDSFSWSYHDSDYFTSHRISGAERLPGGNTLVCSGEEGLIFEVTPDGQRVWELGLDELRLEGRARSAFRAPFYPANHPGVVAVTR